MQEVAGFLPTEDVIGRVAPRGAIVVDVALEELEEIGGEIKLPRFFAAFKNFLEEFFGAFAAEEMFLIGGFLVAVAWGKHHALDVQFHHGIKEFADASGIGAFEEGGIGGDTEAASDRFFDGFEGDLVGSIAADGGVVFRFETIHMNAEGEVFGGFKEIELPLEEECVGAKINVLFAGNEAFDDRIDLGMDQRFAARDGDHGGAALVGGVPALLGGEAFIKDVIGVLDFTATCARKIAAEEGLEHKDKRIPFDPTQLLPEDVGGNCPSVANRNWQKRRDEATNLQSFVNGCRKTYKMHKIVNNSSL